MVQALVYFVNVVFLSGICGGHFNPAVTVGVFIKEGRNKFKQNWAYAFWIIVSQFTGGLIGVLMSFMLANSNGATQT